MFSHSERCFGILVDESCQIRLSLERVITEVLSKHQKLVVKRIRMKAYVEHE